jgi:hydrogenase expression/formation protein HypC
MCLQAPARVLAVEGPEVVIDFDGRRRRASHLLVPDVAQGDWVFVGAGTVLRRLRPEEAEEILNMLRAAGSDGPSSRLEAPDDRPAPSPVRA